MANQITVLYIYIIGGNWGDFIITCNVMFELSCVINEYRYQVVKAFIALYSILFYFILYYILFLYYYKYNDT